MPHVVEEILEMIRDSHQQRLLRAHRKAESRGVGAERIVYVRGRAIMKKVLTQPSEKSPVFRFLFVFLFIRCCRDTRRVLLVGKLLVTGLVSA